MAEIKAVLTGDLVASTAAPAAAVDATMDCIAQAAGRIDPQNRFTRFRGDGWQIVLARPAACFRAAALILASLRAAGDMLDTRIAIGLGTVRAPGSSSLGDAQGEAFQLSGHALDTMPRPRRLAIDGPWGDFMHWPRAALSHLEFSSARWSREQAEALLIMLDRAPPTQTDAAEGLGISRQALRDRLDGAGLRVLTDMLYAFETAAFPPRIRTDA